MKRRFQDQPAQPARERHAQLRRFMGTRPGARFRYGALLTNALDLRCVPRALDACARTRAPLKSCGLCFDPHDRAPNASGELRPCGCVALVRVTPEALDAYISGLPCQSANAQVASQVRVSLAVVGASNGRSRPAPSRRRRGRARSYFAPCRHRSGRRQAAAIHYRRRSHGYSSLS